MNFRTLTLASLYLFLASLAATQTVYGGGLEGVRWVSLFAYGIFGALTYFETEHRSPIGSLNATVAFYLALWSFTVIFGVHPQYSGFRFLSHALIIISSLVFLPQVVTLNNAPKLLGALKIIIGIALVVSYIKPAPRTIFDETNMFRGIFGNANSFGHMCAVGALLYLHGFLTQRQARMRYLHLALTILAVVLMFRSGARSSTIALLAGFVTLALFYRRQFSRNLVIVWGVGSVLLLAGIAFQPTINTFVNKHPDSDRNGEPIDRLGASRFPIWIASLEAFEERPIFGWGFGVDKDTDVSGWNGQFTSLGFSRRDPVNDFTYTLETGGVVGAFAYFFLLSILTRLWLPKYRVLPLISNLNPSEYLIAESALETQQAFMCLAVLLAVMFEFDGTALSAGYFFAPLIWVSVGLCASLHGLLVYDLPRKMSWAYLSAREATSFNK